MSRSRIQIIKASGEAVPFNEHKLRRSLERSGAMGSQIDQVMGEVDKFLYDGITTRKIYRKAYDVLHKSSRGNAARYKLKKAIMELGPSGYPFEQFVGAILDQQGYQTMIGVSMPGRCVQHEIDVLAIKNSNLIMVECKFHNRPGVKCDVKVPLYIHSRFEDVKLGIPSGESLSISERSNRNNSAMETAIRINKDETQFTDYEGWIVTNTRFTEDAIQYGKCTGLVMLGWDYPEKGSLRERIGLSGLHPITCLGTLKFREKKLLMEQGVVLCRNIVSDAGLMKDIGVSDNRVSKILDECHELVHELEVPEE